MSSAHVSWHGIRYRLPSRCRSKRVASSSLPRPLPLFANASSCVRKKLSSEIETRVPLNTEPMSNDVSVSARKMRSNDGSTMSVTVAVGDFTSYVFAYCAVMPMRLRLSRK